jgi:hypothetical protein
MRHLLLLGLLFYGGILRANCFSDLNEMVQRRLNHELHLDKGVTHQSENQTIIFNRLNFSSEEQQLVSNTIDDINNVVLSGKSIQIPDQISTSCGIDMKNGCLHFHHLYFDVDSLSFGSNLTNAEKMAIVAHEYGHAILNRNLSGQFPELIEYWKLGSEYQVLKQVDDMISANDVRLRQLELAEKFNLIPLYNALGELFADSVAVLNRKDPGIIASLIGKGYLKKYPNLEDVSQLSTAAQNKLYYRQFETGLNMPPEVSADIHQTFYIVRHKISSCLRDAFESPEKSEIIIAELAEATKKTLQYFTDQDPLAAKSFREFIERLESGNTLDTAQTMSFQNLVEKLNQVFLQNHNTNK